MPSKTQSKYAKPAFIILILVILGVLAYEYSTWDGTWPEDEAAESVE